MLQRLEGHFEGHCQTELFFQTWSDESPKGVFIITHGLAEHSECYHPLAKTLAQDGWLVAGWDLPGHGRSDGKRGVVRDFTEYQKDLVLFREQLEKNFEIADKPWILFGHSLGGLITLRTLCEEDLSPTAAVCSSPALGLSMKVPVFKEIIAKMASRLLPTLTLHNEINYDDLSHDDDVRRSYASDNLRHDKISPGVFLGMIESFQLVTDKAARLTLPILFQLAGEDRLVSTVASQKLFSLLPNKKNQMIVYPESFHEVYNDMDRQQAIADLKKFLSSLAGNL